MERARRSYLEIGNVYRLHEFGNKGRGDYILKVYARIPDDSYSDCSYVVRSIKSGWTMHIHGVNMYSDGSIDWDFSTRGIYTDVIDGVLVQRRY